MAAGDKSPGEDLLVRGTRRIPQIDYAGKESRTAAQNKITLVICPR